MERHAFNISCTGLYTLSLLFHTLQYSCLYRQKCVQCSSKMNTKLCPNCNRLWTTAIGGCPRWVTHCWWPDCTRGGMALASQHTERLQTHMWWDCSQHSVGYHFSSLLQWPTVSGVESLCCMWNAMISIERFWTHVQVLKIIASLKTC